MILVLYRSSTVVMYGKMPFRMHAAIKHTREIIPRSHVQCRNDLDMSSLSELAVISHIRYYATVARWEAL